MVRVACCWDDGLETDIRLIELLKKYHDLCHAGECDFTVFLGDMLYGIEASGAWTR